MANPSNRRRSTREKLLAAALEVYAQGGAIAATSRRIAERAGVNEVTLFRHFGSKDALLEDALAQLYGSGPPPLTADPRAPRAELVHWCSEVLKHLRHRAPLIRTCIAEAEERAGLVEHVAGTPRRLLAELARYLDALRRAGRTDSSGEHDAHAAALVAALFADAVSRDVLPELFPPQRDAPARYVDALLAALRAVPAAVPAPVRAPPPPPPSLPDATGA
jgi:AcrR family transcriptional regulator